MQLKNLLRRVGALALAMTMALAACPMSALAEETAAMTTAMMAATPETAPETVPETTPGKTLPGDPPTEGEQVTAAEEPASDEIVSYALAEGSYTKITTAAAFTTGEYVLAVETGYAMGSLDGSWISTAQIAPDGDTVTGAPVWTVTVDGDTAVLTDANGVSIAPKGGNANGIKTGDYTWNWAVDAAGTFTFAGQGEDTVLLASNKSYENKFRAYKSGTVTGNSAASYPHAFSLYKKDEAAAPTELTGTLVSEPQSGDRVVIVLPKENQAISSVAESYTGSNGVTKNQLTEAAVTLADGVMTAAADTTAAVFDVARNGDQYVFVCDGKYLTAGETGSNLTLADTATKYSIWELEAANGGSFIKNANAAYNEKPQYIEYYKNFTTYSMGEDASIYTHQFYKIGTTEAIPAWPSEAGDAPLVDGDTVVIWASAYQMALSSVYSGYYNTGVSVSLATDGSLTGYKASEVWTVKDNGDKTYSFAYGGQNLGMAASYSSLTLGAVNDKWTLEDAGNGSYYVKNTVRGSYIEWYAGNSNWSGYGTIAAGSEGQFALTFTPVKAPETPDTPDASTLTVLAAPAGGASLTVGDTVSLTAAEGLEIYYTLATGSDTPADPDVTNAAQKYTGPITIPALPATIKAVASRPAAADAEVATGAVTVFRYKEAVGLDGFTPYFGQLHAHTNISDGAGTVEQAFEHASKVENLDFLAVTDHSNSFDNDTDAGVGLAKDGTAVSSEFAEGRQAAAEITAVDNDFVGLYGFEMTWSDGFGHINTFNTPGFESRSNKDFGNKSGADSGYRLYYQKLTEVPQSLSQFNHPGTTFGDFQDFAFYSAAVDQRINLIEVGNGEGAVGSSGYFPSYEYYTRALDKGWHVAPTNNQDNHKGNWGDSNTARSVVLATDLSQQSIYDAIGSYRVYATEDNDLTILYSLNGNVMGSILGKQDNIHIKAKITDPTDADNAKVDLIVNGGLVAASQTLSGGNGVVTFELPTNDYAYYYLRVTQADKQIAVTAPVWTGEGVNAGLASTTCDTELIVKDESVNITSALYNNTQSSMTVRSLRYMVGDTVIEEATGEKLAAISTVNSGASANYTFRYTPSTVGSTTINVTLVALVDGTEQTFTGVLRLSVTDAALVTRILVDGTHYNDYVTGYYSDRMANFAALAAGENAQVTIKQPGESITAADLEGVSLLVVSAPLKYAGNNVAAGAQVSVFEPEFVQLVADYAKNGGNVVLAGLADYQDSDDGAPYCSTEQINPILESMGATMRLNDDEVLDDDTNYNGGATQTYRVYMDDFNTTAFPGLFEGVQSGQRYSAYSGASVDIGANGVALVKGSANCYSINAKVRPAGGEGRWDSGKPKGSTATGGYDADTAVVQKGDVVTLATEAVGSGRVYLAGTVFCSNFEISDSASVDYGDASYANKVILSNLIDGIAKPITVTPIADVRAAYKSEADKGRVFTVQGKVTAGNVEPNAFFDTIYIQDTTGGLDIYPIATTDGTFLPGQTVQITGSLDAYQGDIELRTISVTMVDANPAPINPAELTLAQASDYAANGGRLIQVSGTVKSVGVTNGVMDTAILTDGSVDYRVFFNSYIGYSDSGSAKLETFVTEGARITAVGVVYNDPEGTCLRVRDRSEIHKVAEVQPEEPDTDDDTPGGGDVRYTIIEGANQKVTFGSTATFRSDADIAKFVGVQVDEQDLPAYTGDRLNWTKWAGSTCVKMSAEYLATLPVGSHTLAIVSTDGKATATFTLAEASAPSGNDPAATPDPGNGNGNNTSSGTTAGTTNNASVVKNTASKAVPVTARAVIPQTGDESQPAILVVLCLLAAAGLTGSCVLRRRNRR